MIMNIYSHRAINTGSKNPAGIIDITNEISEKPICTLPDVISGTVTRTINTEDTLEFTYPANGENVNQISLRRIIEVKADPYRETQYFRIQTIDKDIEGLISIYAIHIAYDLIDHCSSVGFDVPCEGNKYTLANIVKDVESQMYDFISSEYGVSSSPLPYQRLYSSGYFKYDLANIKIPDDFFSQMGILGPVTFREAILTDDSSLLNIMGGEIEFDRYRIKHQEKIGKNTGFRIDYGVNMTGFTYSRSCENIYSDILPYWKGTVQTNNVLYTDCIRRLCMPDDSDTKTVNFMGYTFNLYPYIENAPVDLLRRNIIPVYYRDSDGNKQRCKYTKILPVDITDIFNNLYGFEDGATWTFFPDRRDIANCGIAYILMNDLGNPTLSMSVDFADLSKSSEFDQHKDLNTLMLGDTVQIVNAIAGVVSEAECTSTKYNIVTDMYDSLELGTPEVKFAETFVKATKKKKHYKTYYRRPIQR